MGKSEGGVMKLRDYYRRPAQLHCQGNMQLWSELESGFVSGHFTIVKPWATHSSSLRLRLSICKVGLMHLSCFPQSTVDVGPESVL